MSLKNFIFSKAFIRNLGLAFAIIVGIAMLLIIWLNIYTRHGQSRSVPDFSGMDIEEAAITARKNKLKYLITDSVYTSIVLPGCVAEQHPLAGLKVKKWRTIALTVNAFNPEMVEMPDLVELPKRQALALIGSSGMETGSLRYVPDISVDVVLQQLHNGKEVSPGELLQRGSVIDLVLGKGLSNQRTVVPNLVGLNLEPARNNIFSASLNLGTFIYDSSIKTADDSLNAFVYKQNPEFNTDATLQLGSSIYLWLTVDSARLPSEPFTQATDSLPSFVPEDQNF
jgi:beta-lactam-binding protein with PASTA domain